MSLIYCLPLTNNLNSYGLYGGINSGYHLVNQNDGKTGNCYSFGKDTALTVLTNSNNKPITNSSGQVIEITNLTDAKTNSYIDIDANVANQLNSAFSFSLWLRIDGWNTAWETYVYGGIGGSSWNNYIFGLLRNNTNSTITFTMGNGTNSTQANCVSDILTTGKWYHVACTYGAGVMKMYIDGVLVNEYVTNITPDFSKISTFHLGALDSITYQTNSSFNDFRLYNHCLSKLEIKRLSQGLVVHYPLNRNDWGQENLLLNAQLLPLASSVTIPLTDSKDNVIIDSFGQRVDISKPANAYTRDCSPRGSTARQLRADGLYEAKCTSAWQGISTWANAYDLVIGQRYTYSFYFYTDGSTKNLSFYPMIYNSNNVRDTSSTLPISVDGGDYVNANSRPFGSFSNTSPKRHYVTFEWNNTMASIIKNGGSIELSIQVHGTFNNGEYGCIYAPKLEIGDKMTQWCPNLSDAFALTMGLDKTTEFDISGFRNNGNKITDTMTYTSDSVKYQISTNFNGIDDGILIDDLVLSNIINNAVTYAFWIKPENESGARSVYFSSYSGTSWSIEKTTDNVIRSYWNGSPDEVCNGATITDGVWQHICITKDGTNDIKVYINGVQKWSSTATHKALTFPTTYRIGRDTRYNDGTPYKGLMSDFRIYATALSADDVKLLYQNSATIDSDGIIHGEVK